MMKMNSVRVFVCMNVNKTLKQRSRSQLNCLLHAREEYRFWDLILLQYRCIRKTRNVACCHRLALFISAAAARHVILLQHQQLMNQHAWLGVARTQP